MIEIRLVEGSTAEIALADNKDLMAQGAQLYKDMHSDNAEASQTAFIAVDDYFNKVQDYLATKGVPAPSSLDIDENQPLIQNRMPDLLADPSNPAFGSGPVNLRTISSIVDRKAVFTAADNKTQNSASPQLPRPLQAPSL
jgi:hypothetical protein